MHQLESPWWPCLQHKVYTLVGSVAIRLIFKGHHWVTMNHMLSLLPQKAAVKCLHPLTVCYSSLLEIELQGTSIYWCGRPNPPLTKAPLLPHQSGIRRLSYRRICRMHSLDEVRRCVCPINYYLLEMDQENVSCERKTRSQWRRLTAMPTNSVLVRRWLSTGWIGAPRRRDIVKKVIVDLIIGRG